MCAVRFDEFLLYLVAIVNGRLPRLAGDGPTNYQVGLYQNFKTLCDNLRGGMLEDFDLKKAFGRTLLVQCVVCGDLIGQYENNEQVAADNLPNGPAWDIMWAGMGRHWFEKHGCTLSGNLGRHLHYGPRPRNIGVRLKCCIHTSYGVEQMEREKTNKEIEKISYDGRWYDLFRLIVGVLSADGVLNAPQASDEEKARIEAFKKFWELFLIRHALKCKRSIFNVIYSTRVFDIPKMLSRLYWILRLATTPARDGAMGTVRLLDALHLIFFYVVEDEVKKCAALHGTQPDVVFGLLYVWLLHDTEGRNPMNLNMRQLLEIAVGQFCKTRFDELHKLRGRELLEMARQSGLKDDAGRFPSFQTEENKDFLNGVGV